MANIQRQGNRGGGGGDSSRVGVERYSDLGEQNLTAFIDPATVC